MSDFQEILQGFGDKDKKEIIGFLQQEEKRINFNQIVHQYTDMCWDKCNVKIQNFMDKQDEACMMHCVERFIDTSYYLTSKFEQRKLDK
ncbi:Mitochondrial import inner membrane translocase subunit tim8 [Lobulomyces angularis]|nr:Mitochondrial import inner membrane translocase subunit tim8 [Lobulomyces angularis]